jgi:glycosyltransferase involved in cell wall biosynthesis
MSRPKVSVVIRCHNEERHIGQLLTGIAQQTERDVEIVVVDSGSTDGTLDVVAQHPARVVRLDPADFSFGRALNRGCEAASGELLVFASAHVYPLYTDWLARLIEPFADPMVALTYGKQRGDARTRYSERRVFERWFPEGAAAEQAHPFCNNANAAVRRAAWMALPYDESLTGLEDLDWARRAQLLGWKVVYVPDATVAHVHEETPARIFNRYKREAIALGRIYPAERFGLSEAGRLLVSNVLSDWYAAWRERVLLRNLSDIVLFRTMQFCGTYRGFAQRGPVSDTLKRRFYYAGDRGAPVDAERSSTGVGNHVQYPAPIARR